MAFKCDPAVTDQLYKEIVAADRSGLLVALETDPGKALRKYRALADDLGHRVGLLNHTDIEHFPPSMGELGLLLLAGIDPRLPPQDHTDVSLAYPAIHQSVDLVTDEPKLRRHLMKQLLAAWTTARLAGKREFAFMATQFGLQEVAPELAKFVVDGNVKAGVRYDYIWALDSLGGAAEMKTIARLLDDPILVGVRPHVVPQPSNEAPQQLRDMVLGVMIRKAGEKIEDYGFNPIPGSLTCTFPDDATRQKALAKWKAREK